MKKDFWDYMHNVMDRESNVYLISMGLGWPRVDEFSSKYPQRFIQTEAAEASALDIAVGLAYSGKIPVLYTITPFYLRGWETIRTFINHESLHCILIGAGRDRDYSIIDGFTHDASDIPEHFKLMDKFDTYYPDTRKEMESAIDTALIIPQPAFISIRK